ncbi:MAG: hypothetical protein Q4D98_08085 [Planctomycetia bacterium]|nr:hypothetical protein [Planctomycetia bacterium]
MNERTMQLRLGAAVLASMVIIAILLSFLGAHNRFFSSSYTIYIRLNDAPGVVEHTPIYQSGILIGRVRKVELLKDEGVLVTAHIFSDKKLHHDQECSLAATLLGDASLRISKRIVEAGEPEPSSEEVKPGETITGRIAFDPVVMMAKMQGQLTVAIDDVCNAAEQLEKVARSADTMFSDNRENVRQIIENARVITDDSRSIITRFSNVFDEEFADNIQTSASQLPETLKNVNTAFVSVEKKVTQAIDKMNTTIDQVSGRFERSLTLVDDSLANMKKITDPISVKAPVWLENIDNILQNMDVFIENMNNPNSTLGLLMRDRELYDHLNLTVGKAADLMRQVEPILFNVETFSEKISQHPELLGLRGALRPDSGRGRTIPWPKGITPPSTSGYGATSFNNYRYTETPAAPERLSPPALGTTTYRQPVPTSLPTVQNSGRRPLLKQAEKCPFSENATVNDPFGTPDIANVSGRTGTGLELEKRPDEQKSQSAGKFSGSAPRVGFPLKKAVPSNIE